jgi:2-iminobutanoate/2-iminopropanoate deaminase
MNINHLEPKGIISQGPYTPAVEVVSGDAKTLYVSGQGTYDPAVGEKYLGDDIERQARLSLANLEAVLAGCGYSLGDLVKVTVFAVKSEDLADINKAYKEKFVDVQHLPARSTVIVAGLPGGMSVEIEAIAVRPEGDV